jgi:hypothetical protein
VRLTRIFHQKKVEANRPIIQLFGVKQHNEQESTGSLQDKDEQTEFGFQALGSRQVVASFDGGQLTSDGGLLLLRDLDRSMGLTRKLAGCFSDSRDPERIEHSVQTLVAQRVLALALGYEDLNDHTTLRHDPLLAAAADKTSGEAMASAPTLNRLELSSARVGRYHKVQVNAAGAESLLLRFGVQSLRRGQREVIIDLDATDDPLHGKQEGRFFHGYYDAYCYLPLYAFIGDAIVWAQLRTADRDGSDGTVEALKKIVAEVRRRCPRARIVIRADSGFCRDDILLWCEENRICYVVGLARNSRLQTELAPALDRAREKACLCGGTARVYHDFNYRTQSSWSRARRVIGKAERLGDKDNPRFIVTNLERDGETLYEKVYCARGEMENRIKEQQQDLFADRLSSASFTANQLRLWLSAFAYVLVERLRAFALKGTELAQATVGTIRLKLFKLAARVEFTTRRMRVRLSDASPMRALFAHVWARLRLLPG